MLKKLATSAALVTLLHAAALAQQPAPTPTPVPAPQAVEQPAAGEDPATSAEACVKSAFELARLAEEKPLTDEEANKLEDLLTKMEAHCDAKQFSEAAAVGADIKSRIETK